MGAKKRRGQKLAPVAGDGLVQGEPQCRVWGDHILDSYSRESVRLDHPLGRRPNGEVSGQLVQGSFEPSDDGASQSRGLMSLVSGSFFSRAPARRRLENTALSESGEIGDARVPCVGRETDDVVDLQGEPTRRGLVTGET